MVARFFVAFGIVFGILPFLAVYSFKAVHPDTPFDLDRQTWALGLIPIVVGWLLFLAPGLIPFVGRRYFPWVARVTGLNAFIDSLRHSYLTMRALLAQVPGALRRLAALRRREDPQTAAQPASPPNLSDGIAVSPDFVGPPVEDVASDSPLTPPAGSGRFADRVKTHFRQWRTQIAAIAANPEAHVDTAKTRLRNLRERVATVRAEHAFSPADLNNYTLEAVGHLKAIAKLATGSLKLDASDQVFVDLVLQSIPEPAGPGQEEPPPTGPLEYPEDHRADLVAAAGRLRISLTDEDFEKAATGDLERGLKVMLAVVSVADHARRRSHFDLHDDPLLGLPLQQSA